MDKLIHFTMHQNKLKIEKHDDVDALDLDQNILNWIHVESIDDKKLIFDLMSKFNVNENVTKDILSLNSTPKLESYDNYLFMILEAIDISGDFTLNTQQLSILVFDNLIISIEEKSRTMVDTIILDIENKKDFFVFSLEYILFRLMDEAIDECFKVLEMVGERIDEIEDVLLINPKKDVLESIYTLKKTLIRTRKTLWLTRNALNKIFRNNYAFLNISNAGYIHDTYDSLIQLIDLTETYRDICSGMLDIYLSSISNKTNDIMKILTIFSTIFIPLTFIAGVYGMNFKYLPELQWKYSYLAFWIVSIVITLWMLRFFKKKEWL